MKKVKDMEPEFFEEFSEEEIEFLEAWEDLYDSKEFKEDLKRIKGGLHNESTLQE